MLLQQIKCFFNLLLERRKILIESFEHQDADIADGRLERFNILDEKERLEKPHRKGIIQMFFCLQYRLLDHCLEGCPDPFKHEIEGGQLAHLVITDLDRYLLKHSEH